MFFPFSFTDWHCLNLSEVLHCLWLHIVPVAPWSSARWLFCPLNAFWVEQARDTHYTRTGTTSFPGGCWLSPSPCPPETKKSQLTPETRESSAAGVRARAYYSSSHILYSTLLFNTIRLRSSARWVTLCGLFIVHSSAFPVFPILWKELLKCRYCHSTALVFYC